MPRRATGGQVSDERPRHLGDAVYATYDGHHIWVKTSSHKDMDATNIIALDPDVFSALVKYGRDITESAPKEE